MTLVVELVLVNAMLLGVTCWLANKLAKTMTSLERQRLKTMSAERTLEELRSVYLREKLQAVELHRALRFGRVPQGEA